MTGFFEEVKRRKVYRVAVAYVIGAGGVIQLASAAFPAWELPNWALRLVIVLLLIGFPIALILAWAFDVTAEGIRPTPSVAGPRPHRRRNIIMLVATGVILSAIAGFFLLPGVSSARKIDKSIAVLPFENLSDDKENAYFADGIQDDVLTNLSKIGDLKVISRTSVMPYRGKASNVREIGKALGVATILEGSVRRIGNRVRVNVQLIDTETDEHIWAEDYDRDLTDVFAIQTDLAQKIATELRAKLSPTEKAQIERRPTENGEAYLAFVQAHNLQGAYEDFEKLKQSEQLYDRAIQLDPKFALALARYSQLESWIGHTFEQTAARREKARALADRALQLQPNLPEGHLALGFSYYYGDNNYDAALREFRAAQRGLPNESEAYLAIGAIERRQGKWAESTANLEKAATLSPNDTWVLQNLFFNYAMHRNFDAANKTIDRAIQLKPERLSLWEIKAKLALSENGDATVGEKLLEKASSMPLSKDEKLTILGSQVDFLLLRRKYEEALEIAEKSPDDLFGAVPGTLVFKYLAIGVAEKGLHNETNARAAFLKAKNICEENLKQKPNDPEVHAQLAKLNAWLGDRDAALSEAQRATQLRPESKDAFEGPKITGQVAEVHAILGDNDRALELLDGLLSRPSDLTVATLKLNPVWDPLRNDPRFQALLNKYGGKS
jgi:TolB-like protein/Flp pilus assembly protein TadD